MSTSLTLTSTVRIPEGMLFHEIDGETVILHPTTGVYFGLDRVGTRIWALLREPGSLHEIVNVLLEEYDVPEDRCQQDLLSLVAHLQEHHLLEPVH